MAQQHDLFARRDSDAVPVEQARHDERHGEQHHIDLDGQRHRQSNDNNPSIDSRMGQYRTDGSRGACRHQLWKYRHSRNNQYAGCSSRERKLAEQHRRLCLWNAENRFHKLAEQLDVHSHEHHSRLQQLADLLDPAGHSR
jgi:hypothetical protein